jgi:hypothetical protein
MEAWPRLAVALRMVRALTEVALAADHRPHHERVLRQARLLEESLSSSFVSADREELQARLATLRKLVDRTEERLACG